MPLATDQKVGGSGPSERDDELADNAYAARTLDALADDPVYPANR
jgi:hypothetical protein